MDWDVFQVANLSNSVENYWLMRVWKFYYEAVAHNDPELRIFIWVANENNRDISFFEHSRESLVPTFKVFKVILHKYFWLGFVIGLMKVLELHVLISLVLSVIMVNLLCPFIETLNDERDHHWLSDPWRSTHYQSPIPQSRVTTLLVSCLNSNSICELMPVFQPMQDLSNSVQISHNLVQSLWGVFLTEHLALYFLRLDYFAEIR